MSVGIHSSGRAAVLLPGLLPKCPSRVSHPGLPPDWSLFRNPCNLEVTSACRRQHAATQLTLHAFRKGETSSKNRKLVTRVGGRRSGPAAQQVALEQPDQGVGELTEHRKQDDGHEEPIEATVVLRILEQESEPEG